MKRTKSFRTSLLKALKDPIEAAEYLNAALEDGDISFLLEALRDVAEAQRGMTQLANLTKLNRANLYKMLSAHGNPRVQTLESVLRTFGLKIGVLPDPKHQRRRAA